MQWLVNSRPFEYCIILTIIANCVVMSMDTHLPNGDKTILALQLVINLKYKILLNFWYSNSTGQQKRRSQLQKIGHEKVKTTLQCWIRLNVFYPTNNNFINKHNLWFHWPLHCHLHFLMLNLLLLCLFLSACASLS